MVKEPLNKSARSAFQSEKPQIVRAVASDSSRSAVLQAGTVCPQDKKCLPEERSARYGRVTSRSRCGFSGETLSGRAFASHPARFGSLIWNDQTALAEATPGDPAKTPSRPCRLVQRLLKTRFRAAIQIKVENLFHAMSLLPAHNKAGSNSENTVIDLGAILIGFSPLAARPILADTEGWVKLQYQRPRSASLIRIISN